MTTLLYNLRIHNKSYEGNLQALRDFLQKQGYEPNSIIRQWAEAGWLRSGESKRLTSRLAELGGRPRMVVLTRATVEGPGDLSTGTPSDPDQAEIPF